MLDRPVFFRLWRGGVASKFVQTGAYRIHYLEAGPAMGPPLLLIHGLGSRGEDWSSLMPAFAAAGLHVYAPDMLGYGQSSRPSDADYSIATEEESVVQFLAAIHLVKTDVIGWSMGGWIAMQLAIDHPSTIRRVVIYDSAGTYFTADLPPGLFAPDDTAGVQRLFDILEPVPRKIPGFIARDLLRKLQSNATVVNRSLASMVGGRYLLDFRLAALRQPMLIMWGRDDHLIPLSVGESIHNAVPQSRLITVKGCGHLAPGECSQAFLVGTIPFLQADPPLPPVEMIVPKPSR